MRRRELFDLATDEHIDEAPINEARHGKTGRSGHSGPIVERRREDAACLIQQPEPLGLLRRIAPRAICPVERPLAFCVRVRELHLGVLQRQGEVPHSVVVAREVLTRRQGGGDTPAQCAERRGEAGDECRPHDERDEREGIAGIVQAQCRGARDAEIFEDQRAEEHRHGAPTHAGVRRRQRNRGI
jgi:hypothetical protein